MDVEVGLLAFFDDLAYTDTFVDWRDLPAHFTSKGGVLRIRRIGGSSDVDVDTPTVSIQSYAPLTAANPRAAHDLDAAVWARFLDVLTGANSGYVAATGLLIEDPSKTSGPVELPSTDPAIAVVESIFKLTVRN